MKGKNLTKFILSVLTITLLVALAVQGAPHILRANSCDADDLCEAERIGIGTDNPYQNTLLHLKGSAFEIRNAIQNTDGRAWLTIQSGQDSEASISFQGGGVTNGSWWTIGSARRDQTFMIDHMSGLGSPEYADFRIKHNGHIQMESLQGRGNAFVCASSDGTLYRSKRPCIL